MLDDALCFMLYLRGVEGGGLERFIEDSHEPIFKKDGRMDNTNSRVALRLKSINGEV